MVKQMVIFTGSCPEVWNKWRKNDESSLQDWKVLQWQFSWCNIPVFAEIVFNYQIGLILILWNMLLVTSDLSLQYCIRCNSQIWKFIYKEFYSLN